MTNTRRAVIAPVTALGIVFGDIGTSPLYAINELLYKTHLHHSKDDIIGSISLVIWLLTVVICIKYVSIVLRADNDEQGGVFALLALLSRHKTRTAAALTSVLVFAAGMLLGDGVITPAISVLSAVEGMSVASSELERMTVPLTLVILLGLFAFQSKGTDKIGRLFGPVMLAWFSFLAVSGANSLAHNPDILHALNPLYAIRFIDELTPSGVALVLGAAILVVTGGEALFADLGHIGKRPIRQSWFSVVYPSLILNYLGQGAYALSGRPVAHDNVFFSMLPGWAVLPSVALATMATVIASQALITGAFSLIAQGMALRYLPTMRVEYTHPEEPGHVYVPSVNWTLFVGSAFLVAAFQSSTHLAVAYGLAVAADMVVTTFAVAAVARLLWQWKKAAVAAVFVPLGVVDGALFLSNVTKIPSGGWLPLVIGAVMVAIMTTWRWGRQQVQNAMMDHSQLTVRQVVQRKHSSNAASFGKPVVFLTTYQPATLSDDAPLVLEMFLDRYGALPDHAILLAVCQTRDPHTLPGKRYELRDFDDGHDDADDTSLIAATAQFGFRDHVDVGQVIREVIGEVVDVWNPRGYQPPSEWLIHASRERIIGFNGGGRVRRLRYSLFRTLRRQAEPADSYFGLHDDARLTVDLIPVTI